MLKALRRAVVWFALIVLAVAARAADTEGRVTFGGLPVPGATVTLTHGDKSLTAISDAQGSYRFSNVDEGDWTIEIQMMGFAPVKRQVSCRSHSA